MDKNRTKNHQDTLAIIQNQCVMILSYVWILELSGFGSGFCSRSWSLP
jgi:hypothetical protein